VVVVEYPDRQTTVLFLWKPRPELQAYLLDGLKDRENVHLVFPSEVSEDELISSAARADIIVGWRPTEAVLSAAPSLELFINPGAGVQHLLDLFRGLTQVRDVVLVNGHGNSYFAAQHAVALLLALANKIIPHHNWMIAGRWRTGDSEAQSIPLRRRSLGLLGYGAVNQKVHRFLSGFDLSFSILRRKWPKHVELPTPAARYRPTRLHDFLETIDTLLVALPLTKETRGLLAEEELALLGPSGLVVNVGRGPVIDEGSLYRALKDRRILGAAIDVWYEYRPKEDAEGRKYPYTFPFHALENVVLSPHRGASPFDDLKRWDEVIENIRRFSAGRRDFLNIVDLKREY
jgi:phosphoglycerate dehydrogenase-like enzyme